MSNITEESFVPDPVLIDKIFNMNTTGSGLNYYSATINGKFRKGERYWNARWDLIKNSMDFNGKNFLEIACNMAILTTFLKKFKNINKAVGVDQPDELLRISGKPTTMQACKLLDVAYGVENMIKYFQVDLNKENYEDILGYDFDVVSALSIYKWMHDKERFLQYLCKFDNIIFEGHESDEQEIAKFSKHGYKAKVLGKTQIGVSYTDDATRTMILFYK